MTSNTHKLFRFLFFSDSPKLYRFTIGLLYPGILGSIIYGLFDNVTKVYDSKCYLNVENYIVTILLILVFVFDYLNTDNSEVKESYIRIQGIFDILIVLILFLSVYVALDVLSWGIEYVALLLAASKFFAMLWEIFSPTRKSCFSGTVYFVFSMLYVFASFNVYLLILILLVDVIVSANFKNIEDKYGDRICRLK